MVVYLKPGDRLDDDRTNITVQIIDIFGDAAIVTFNVQVCFRHNLMAAILLRKGQRP